MIVMRILCLVIGYACGMFLTADVVTRIKIKKSVFEIGTHNPGMANVMHELGFWPGAVVLMGDIFKTFIACAICGSLFPVLGMTGIMYAGVGTVLGHDFPVWHGFRGGKGVAVTCVLLIFFAPIYGTLSDVVGMLVVFATGFLGLGAIVITSVYGVISIFTNSLEVTLLVIAFIGKKNFSTLL